jgi:hypothetical protein
MSTDECYLMRPHVIAKEVGTMDTADNCKQWGTDPDVVEPNNASRESNAIIPPSISNGKNNWKKPG